MRFPARALAPLQAGRRRKYILKGRFPNVTTLRPSSALVVARLSHWLLISLGEKAFEGRYTFLSY